MTSSPSQRARGRGAQAPGAGRPTLHAWREPTARLGATVFLAIALTACGAATSSPSGGPSSQDKPAAGESYRSCLAAHGLVATPSGTSSPSSARTTGSAAAKEARAACRSLRADSARRAYRSCLAAHGLTAKPAGANSPSPARTTGSATAKSARAACRSLRPGRSASSSPSPTASP